MNLGSKLLLNWLAVVVGVVLGIVLYRLQLGALGPTALGTWIAISSLCGYLSLLELGLGAAVNKYSAATGALRQREREEALLSTALALYLVLAALALCGGAIFGRLLRPLLHVQPPLLESGQLAVLLLSLNIAAAFVLCVWRGLVFGRGRTDVVAGVTITRHLVYAALVVLFLRRGRGFLGLAVAGLLADVMTGLCLVAFARRTCAARVRLRLPDPRMARELLRYCSAIIIIIAGQQLLRGVALPLIQRYLGPEAVTAYGPADRLATLFFTLVGQMGMVMVPPVAAACAVDPGAALPALVRTGRLALALGLPPLLMLLLLGDRLLVAWLGPAMAGSALYLRLLGIALLAQLVAFGTDVGAYAVGGRRAYSLTKLGCGLASVVIVYAGVRLGATAGAALGCGLAIALCDALLTPLAVCRSLGLSPAAYFGGLLGRAPQALALLAGASLCLWAVRPAGILATLGCGAAGSAVGWALIYVSYMREEDRALLRSRLHHPRSTGAVGAVAPLKEGV
jgi:O-antigen/teichoic acid export membrane protein